MKSKNYDYLVFSARDYTRLMRKHNLTKENVDSLIREIANSGFFRVAYKGKTMFAFRVVS